jgi:hypothetical protein
VRVSTKYDVVWVTYEIDDFPLLPVILYDCIVLAFLIGLVFA